MDDESFIAGLLLGIVVAGYFGWVLQNIRVNQTKSRKAGEPMSIVLKTDRTPSAVVGESNRAAGCATIWIAWFVISLVIVGFVVMWFMGYSLEW